MTALAIGWRLSAVLGLAVAAPLAARDDDPRLRSVAWRGDTPIELAVRPGRMLAVMLAPSEKVVDFTAVDPAQFIVDRALDGDGLLITPRLPNARSALMVTTARRRYRFELITRDDPATPLIVRLTYPRNARATRAKVAEQPADGNWKLSGSRTLRPASTSDEGGKTYIVWRDDQDIPAVFARTATGREEVVDGYMRDGRFVIDRVHPRLIFRIDRNTATAVREGNRR